MDSYSHLWCSFIQEKESTEYKVHGCGGILVEVCLYNAVSLRLQISNAKKLCFPKILLDAWSSWELRPIIKKLHTIQIGHQDAEKNVYRVNYYNTPQFW